MSEPEKLGGGTSESDSRPLSQTPGATPYSSSVMPAIEEATVPCVSPATVVFSPPIAAVIIHVATAS